MVNPVRVLLPVASSIVDQRTRSAFSETCLRDIVRQLNEREVAATYEYRAASVAGRTLVGTARLEDREVAVVEIDLAPPWWTPEELEHVMLSRGIGGGIAGRMLKESQLGALHVTEQILVATVTLLQLHVSCDPSRPAEKL